MKARRVVVKLYDWTALLRLAVEDMQRKSGAKLELGHDIHYLAGLDAFGNPCLRIDLTPLKVRRRN